MVYSLVVSGRFTQGLLVIDSRVGLINLPEWTGIVFYNLCLHQNIKRMKAILMLIFSLTTTVAVNGQVKNEGQSDFNTMDRKEAQEEAAEMKDELQLSPEQTRALEELTYKHLQYTRKMEGVQRGSGQLSPRVFLRAKSEYRDGVSEILTKEQYKDWKKLSEGEQPEK